MPKQSTKTILAALKKAGLDLGDDRDAVTEALEDIELSAEEFLERDQMIIAKDERRKLQDDIREATTKAKEAEKVATELREMVDTGDSDNARKAETYKKKLDAIEPMVEKFIEKTAKSWEAAQAKIPENLRAEFLAPEKDKKLSNDDMLANADKFDDFVRLGLIDPAAEPDPDPGEPKTPTAPRIAGKQTPAGKLTKQELEEMPSRAKIEAGYKPYTPTGGGKT